MFRYLLGFCLCITAFESCLAQTTVTDQDIQNTLSRAERLYFEARFRESIQLLTPLDLALKTQVNRVRESIKVKLQLGLAHIGLNEMEQARTRFAELCALDPAYDLDPAQFAPKVLTVFSEARFDQSKAKCSAVCDEANMLLNANNMTTLLGLLQTAPKTCVCLDVIAKDAAEAFYRQGQQAYRASDYAQALQDFKTALNLNPQHELASQYSDLTQSKIQLATDRLILEWRKYFEALEFNQATAIYLQLASPNLADKTGAAREQIRAEYRKSVSGFVQSWKQGCSAGRTVSLETARQQAAAMLPDPSIAPDILEQITPCAPATPVSAAKPQTCLQMGTQNAMLRLKSRVNPQIPRGAAPTGTVRFTTKVRIDDAGNVSVLDVQGANGSLNNSVRAAVEQWKFAPAVVEGQTRCVETELPIVLNP
jgi:tetratricopeptide (TPR) repeat protein